MQTFLLASGVRLYPGGHRGTNPAAVAVGVSRQQHATYGADPRHSGLLNVAAVTAPPLPALPVPGYVNMIRNGGDLPAHVALPSGHAQDALPNGSFSSAVAALPPSLAVAAIPFSAIVKIGCARCLPPTRRGGSPGAVGAGAAPEHIGQRRHPPRTSELNPKAGNRKPAQHNQ